jgi:Xaa-Pro aminopeptidase
LISETDMLRFNEVSCDATSAVPSVLAEDLRSGIAMFGLAGRPIGVEPHTLTFALGQILADVARPRDATAALTRARVPLDDAGRDRLRANVALIEQALGAAAEVAEAGVTELAVACAALTSLCHATGRAIAFAGNMASGRENVNPDSVPSSRRLLAGDAFFLDLYPELGAYSADLTRCFTIGPPSAEVSRVHRALEDALTAALTAIRPGTTASAVDASVRRVLETHGLLAHFPHPTGHGLGLFLPEPPWLVPGDQTVLEPGMALAIEPGAYVPGVGGLRVEINVGVTHNGCEVFGSMRPHLLVCDRPPAEGRA